MSDYKMDIDIRKRRASDSPEDAHRDKKKRRGGRRRQNYDAAAPVAEEPRGQRPFAGSGCPRTGNPRRAGRLVKTPRSRFRDDSAKDRERGLSSSCVRPGSSLPPPRVPRPPNVLTGMAMEVDDVPAAVSVPTLAAAPAAAPAADDDVEMSDGIPANNNRLQLFAAAPAAAAAVSVSVSDDVEMGEGDGDGDGDTEMPDSDPDSSAAWGHVLVLGYNGFRTLDPRLEWEVTALD